MANLTPTPGWDDVLQLETTTTATGGPGGIMNSQAQSLLNRTEKLNQDLSELSNGLGALESKVTGLSNAARQGLTSLLTMSTTYLRNNIVILGDSITTGVGDSTGKLGYAASLGQAICNYFRNGYGFPLHMNYQIAGRLWSHNGTTGTNGLGMSSVTITTAQAITLCKAEAIGVMMLIDGPASTCTSIQLKVNGVVLDTQNKPTGNPGELFLFKDTAPWKSCDTITIAPVGGNLVVLAACPTKRGINPEQTNKDYSPVVITCGASGKSFAHFNTNYAQVSTLLSVYTGASPSVVILALGTNSIYNSTEAQTPTEYITAMMNLVNSLTASGAKVVLTIPPQANEATWPIIKPGFTYQDYVDALKTAAGTTYDLLDLNAVGLAYSDGVHPNTSGHVALAAHYCRLIGIEPNFTQPQLNHSVALTGASPVILTDAYAVVDERGTVSLSGKINPNGSGSNLLTTLPFYYRPRVDRKFIVPLETNGFGQVTIYTNGEVRMTANSIAWTLGYLDGISY